MCLVVVILLTLRTSNKAGDSATGNVEPAAATVGAAAEEGEGGTEATTMGAADMEDEIMDVEATAELDSEIDEGCGSPRTEAFLLARFLKAAAKELAELELEAVLMAVLVTMVETTAGAGTAGVVALAGIEMFCYQDDFSSYYDFDPFFSLCCALPSGRRATPASAAAERRLAALC